MDIPIENEEVSIEEDAVGLATEETLARLSSALNADDSALVTEASLLAGALNADDTALVTEPQTTDRDAHYGVAGYAFAADETVVTDMSAEGAENLSGRVRSTGEFLVEIEWQDENGNVIFTDDLSGGGSFTGGETVNIDRTSISDYVTVRITNSLSTQQTLDATLVNR
jgi:hypothetical protein